MALLTTKERNRLKSRDFGLPRERKYPIENKAHARNALARVAANGTPKEKRIVRRRVHAKYNDLARLMA